METTDIITTIVVNEATRIIIDLLLAALGLMGLFIGNQARKYLGEKTTDRLRDRLDEALDRALADAQKRGLNHAVAVDFATEYVNRTLTSTVQKLGASKGALAKRAEAQLALHTL